MQENHAPAVQSGMCKRILETSEKPITSYHSMGMKIYIISYYYAQWMIWQQLQLKSAVPWPDMQMANKKVHF